ncbi:MAG: Gfo/Idh/MocA family oxidoreductase [Deltaproteobacteria bacterium]|nr:Gfo/Idh/MocA family oxidoreductase [Deltaproteobacteria bacterium]
MIPIAVVGVGGWGKNLARNYHQIPGASLRYICDLDQKKLEQMGLQLPGTKTTRRFEDLLEDPALRAVVIATTAVSHYALCKAALLAGKDVYVEKPFVMNVAQAEELIAIARRDARILMVGHLLEYHPAIIRLKEMIEARELGDIYYIYNQRVNLGTIRGDENALWNFAPHDISIILYLLGKEPTDVAARGQSYVQKGIEDVVFLTLNFNGQSMAHVHVSWLDPHKIRRVTIVGSKKMAVFDDGESTEKLKIYDKSASQGSEYDTFAQYVTIRFGDITIPYLKMDEPLRIECLHFLECVRERKQPLSDGYDGLRVVKVLDAAQRSLQKNGTPVAIDSLG